MEIYPSRPFVVLRLCQECAHFREAFCLSEFFFGSIGKPFAKLANFPTIRQIVHAGFVIEIEWLSA